MKDFYNTIRLLAATFIGVAVFAFPGAAQALTAPTVVVTDSQATAISVVWYGNVWGVATERVIAAGSTYEVTLLDKKTGNQVTTLATGENTNTFTDLTPNHPYLLSVTMTQGDENSVTQKTVRTTPAEAAKLKVATVARQVQRDVIGNNPLNQFGDASSSKWLAKLSWKKPQGKIRSYQVNVYNSNDKLVATKSTTKRSVGISGLKLKRDYEYEVVSYFNNSYESAASQRKSFRLKKKY
ncbi:MAG: hypothetical protein CO132_03510 [Candidatus Kerfeldbacteria bacterium CG_4_9_14_3_um_filter_45_8]|nr:MAG: hypothetical protein CO132_03510 [Candidatus Kerfeldbacteria bacterium CG_4_9_14_3_um_filter_45_8]